MLIFSVRNHVRANIFHTAAALMNSSVEFIHWYITHSSKYTLEHTGTETVFNRDNAKGFFLGNYTNQELQFIGCIDDGCEASSVFCTDSSTPGENITFGTHSNSAMRACHGVESVSSCQFSGCCDQPGGLCNAPDTSASAVEMCRTLGYSNGFVERKLESNTCPETHWDGSHWTSDFDNSHGSGLSYICTDASGLSDVSTIVSFNDTMVIGSFEWNVREERSLSIQKQYETYIFASDLSSAKKYVSYDDVSPMILIPGSDEVPTYERDIFWEKAQGDRTCTFEYYYKNFCGDDSRDWSVDADNVKTPILLDPVVTYGDCTATCNSCSPHQCKDAFEQCTHQCKDAFAHYIDADGDHKTITLIDNSGAAAKALNLKVSPDECVSTVSTGYGVTYTLDDGLSYESLRGFGWESSDPLQHLVVLTEGSETFFDRNGSRWRLDVIPGVTYHVVVVFGDPYVSYRSMA